MSADELFSLSGALALAGWVVLLFAPRGRLWLDLVPFLLIPAGLSLLYGGLVLAHFAASGGGYGSLDAVRLLFGSDWMLLAGWVHYLAFDLIVGAVMAGRMDRAGVMRLVQVPVLLCIVLFGPLGVVLALVTEGALRLPLPRLKGALS